MQQGYEPTDITILAAYSGQMFYMKKVSLEFLDLIKRNEATLMKLKSLLCDCSEAQRIIVQIIIQ